MFNLGALGAAVTLDDSQYRRKLQQLGEETKGMLGKIAGIGAAYLGFNTLRGAVEGCIKAFIAQEDAVDNLEDALTLKGAQGYSEELQKLASDLQKVTTYGDEATIAVMALGINMGIPAAKMEDATKAAMGLAAAYNMDLSTAMQGVAKAYNGNITMLTKNGLKIDETKSKQEQFNEVLEKGKAAFPLAEADTFGAKLQQLANVWGDLQKAVGNFILELFGADKATGGLMQAITDATEYIKQHTAEWVFLIKYFYAYLEAGVQAVWATIEPALTFLWKQVNALVNDVSVAAQWCFDAVCEIWKNLPDIFAAIGKDIVAYYRNLFDLLLNASKNYYKAIWETLKGNGIEGFKQVSDQLAADAAKLVGDVGKKTAEAMGNVSIAGISGLQAGTGFNEMVEQYKRLDGVLSQIDQKRIRRQAELEADYAKKLERSKTDGNNKGGAADAGSGKNDVAGSFSAAVLAAMLGSGGPEAETAKNTKEMVRLQREQLTQNKAAGEYAG